MCFGLLSTPNFGSEGKSQDKEKGGDRYTTQRTAEFRNSTEIAAGSGSVQLS